MTDAEWNSWLSTWTGATGPLPDVRSRARREARLHRLASAAFFGLVAIALAASAVPFGDRSPAVRAICWIILAFVASMSVGYLLLRRGVGAARTGNPRDALAFLERRLRMERRVAHLVRWSYAFLCVAFVIVFPRVVQDHEAPRLEMGISFPLMFLVFLVTFSAPWWVARRSRRHNEEIQHWRRWMDEQRL